MESVPTHENAKEKSRFFNEKMQNFATLLWLPEASPSHTEPSLHACEPRPIEWYRSLAIQRRVEKVLRKASLHEYYIIVDERFRLFLLVSQYLQVQIEIVLLVVLFLIIYVETVL